MSIAFLLESVVAAAQPSGCDSASRPGAVNRENLEHSLRRGLVEQRIVAGNMLDVLGCDSRQVNEDEERARVPARSHPKIYVAVTRARQSTAFRISDCSTPASIPIF